MDTEIMLMLFVAFFSDNHNSLKTGKVVRQAA
jgi:hypothetical protein